MKSVVRSLLFVFLSLAFLFALNLSSEEAEANGAGVTREGVISEEIEMVGFPTKIVDSNTSAPTLIDNMLDTAADPVSLGFFCLTLVMLALTWRGAR